MTKPPDATSTSHPQTPHQPTVVRPRSSPNSRDSQPVSSSKKFRPARVNIPSYDPSPSAAGKRTHTPLAEKFRISDSSSQPRRTTRQTALPLAFDGKHLKKLLDHNCTAEQLNYWVQSSPVVRILKDWVQTTLQDRHHDGKYRALLLPAESEGKWGEFEEDCVELAVARIKGEENSEPAQDGAAKGCSQAIERLVSESWTDDVSGPLNNGIRLGFLDKWSYERAFDLLHSVYEDLRNEPNNGYFANLLGGFTGERYIPVPPGLKSDAERKPACDACRSNHIACDRGEPVCGQCKHLKVLCNKTGDIVGNITGGTSNQESLSSPLRMLPSKLFPQSLQSYNTDTPVCRTCRVRHRACDRNRPMCGECSKRGVDCIWPDLVVNSSDLAGGTQDTAETINRTDKPETNLVAGRPRRRVIESESTESLAMKSPWLDTKHASCKSDAPAVKRPRLSVQNARSKIKNSTPKPELPILDNYGEAGRAEEKVFQAPTAQMMAEMMVRRKFGIAQSDRLAGMGQPSYPVPHPTPNNQLHQADSAPGQKLRNEGKQQAVTGSDILDYSASRTPKADSHASSGHRQSPSHPVPSWFPAYPFKSREARQLTAQSPSHSIPSWFPAQPSETLEAQQLTTPSKPKRKGDTSLVKPNTATVAAGVKPNHPPPNEVARLSTSLQYCQTLFEEILAGRNAPNAANMGITAIRYALSKD
jgi:hypothetical protein